MTLISMALGCTCFGLYIGTMGSIMQRVNASGKKFDEMILEVNEYMKFRNIPPRLQKRMLRYYEQRYRKHYFDENQILENVSDVLRNDLLMHNCKHLIENAPLFRDLPDSFLKMIVQKLTFQVGKARWGAVHKLCSASGWAGWVWELQEGVVEEWSKSHDASRKLNYAKISKLRCKKIKFVLAVQNFN